MGLARGRPAGAQSLLSLKPPLGDSGCRQLQATGTAKFRERWWPARRTDISGYTHTTQRVFLFLFLVVFFFTESLLTHTQVDNIARISTSDAPVTPPAGWGGTQGGGADVPSSDFRNTGHCVDPSPRLHEVQGPRVLSAMLTGDHAGVCNRHLSPAPLPCSRLRARGGAGRGGPAPPLPTPRRLPVAGAASPSPPE